MCQSSKSSKKKSIKIPSNFPTSSKVFFFFALQKSHLKSIRISHRTLRSDHCAQERPAAADETRLPRPQVFAARRHIELKSLAALQPRGESSRLIHVEAMDVSLKWMDLYVIYWTYIRRPLPIARGARQRRGCKGTRHPVALPCGSSFAFFWRSKAPSGIHWHAVPV